MKKNRIKLYIAIVLAFLCFSANVSAQKNEFDKKKTLKEVRANIKSEKYSQAADALSKAMKEHPEANNDVEFHYYMMETQHYLAEAENRKIYLNNKPDTAAYFADILKVYQYGLSCDSLDRIPDEKGRVKPHYTSAISNNLMLYRNNIKSGGRYYYKKMTYPQAFSFFDMYMSTTHNPLITSGKGYKTETDTLDISTLALYSAFGKTDYKSALKYFNVALENPSNRAFVYQLGAKSEMEVGDTATAVEYLYEGWKIDPSRDYFCSTLVDYHVDRKEYDKAEAVIDAQLEVTPEERRLWYLKGKCLYCQDSLDSAIDCYKKAISCQSDDAESYSSLGSVYIQKAHKAYDDNNYRVGTRAYSRAKKAQDGFYSQALENFELARKYAPEDNSLWLAGLREVYYKLNMGKELESLEK